MITKINLLAMFAIAAIAAAPSGAHASVDAEAIAAFEQGKQLFHDEKYVEAANAFRRAHELKRSWKLLFNIGQSEAAAKNYGQALEALERYLSEGGDDITTERQRGVQDEIGRLRNMVGFLEIEGEDGDAIQVNGKPRGTLPRAAMIRVAMGDAQIVVRRGDEIVYEAEVQIFGAKTKRITVAAERAPETSEEAPAAAPPEEEEEERRVWTWVALGIGGAAAVGAGITGGLALSNRSELDSECEGNVCPEDLESTEQATLNLAITTDVLIGAAVLGVGLGVIFYFVEPGWSSEREVAVTPLIAPEMAGLALAGRF